MALGKTRQGANTILEGLANIAGELAQLSVMPDAIPHIHFVNGLITEIQKYLHKPDVGGQALDPGQAAGAGQMPGGGGGAAPPPGMVPPPGIQNMQPPTPNPDELRRMLAMAGRSA